MKLILSAILCIFIVGCMNHKLSATVSSGMSIEQVVEIEGKPTESAQQGKYTLLLYVDRKNLNYPNEITDNTFTFIDNQLVSYTVENIRTRNDTHNINYKSANQRLTNLIKSLNKPLNPSAVASCTQKNNKAVDCH